MLQKPATDLALKLFKPLTDKLAKIAGEQFNVAYHKIFNSYSKYLEESYSRHIFFSSIVFKNEQKKLDDYYIPLTITRSSQHSSDQFQITCFPTDLIKSTEKILIVDTAGMGKTTLLKVLFLNCVRQQIGIPIYVELRKLSRKMSLIDFIIAQLSAIDGNCKKDLLYNLISSGEFVFFWDGYDEIPEIERAAVTADLQDFLTRAPKNLFVMTSRDEAGLVSFPSFQRFVINPLTKDEAYRLLEKYADPNMAKTLITKLELPENLGIHEFLKNPLLTSLLYKSFEFKATIPLKKHIFYRQVFEALYEVHDLTKEGGEYNRVKRSGLDIDRFDQILRYLAYLTYKAAKIEFSKDELLTFIDSARKMASEGKSQSSKISHDLTHAVPLMTLDGNYIRWSHKSIQEYFAAQYLCRDTKGKTGEILLKYYKQTDPRSHANLLSLCADIDRTAFRHSIIKVMIEDCLAEFSKIYSKTFEGISDDDVIRRKRLCVGKGLFLTNIALPQNFDYKSPNQMQTLEPELEIITKFMEEKCGKFNGNTIQIVNPGIAYTKAHLDLVIEAFREKVGFSFLKPRSWIENIEIPKIDIDANIKVIEIDDDRDNPVNSILNFKTINLLLSRAVEWEFDEIEAKRILDEINDEISSQLNLMQF
jgi:hypothetical protein